MNRDILQRMPNPTLLTAWHMGLSSVLIRLLRWSLPADSTLFGKDVPRIDMRTLCVKLVPIAALFSLSLAFGNRAYIHCSVAFIQMVKASHSVITYTLNTLVGAEFFLWSKFRLVCIVWFGVVLAITGEVNFVPTGFWCQCLSSLAECTRIVLIGLLLNRSGFKLDPLTALSYYAPLCFMLLLPSAILTEFPSNTSMWIEKFEARIGYTWIMLNGLVAFGLNLATVLLIQATSPVIFILCGIMKDVLIISGSMVLLGSTISLQQGFGYALAVIAIQIFNQVGKNPQHFERHGLEHGLMKLICQSGGSACQQSSHATKKNHDLELAEPLQTPV